MLVIQEIFGLTDWLRSMCDELAENGVIAIAPDFLNGQKFEDADSASKATSAVTQEQMKAVLDATSDYALKIPACNGTLAVCGFCRGGGWAFAYANENPKLKAAYSFYGTAPDEASKVANIQCPVYGFYGENDERVNATIPKAEELMKAAGKKYEPVIYKGAGHGFMRSGEPSNPAVREGDKKARDEAWERWKKLLKQLRYLVVREPRGTSRTCVVVVPDKTCRRSRDPRVFYRPSGASASYTLKCPVIRRSQQRQRALPSV